MCKPLRPSSVLSFEVNLVRGREVEVFARKPSVVRSPACLEEAMKLYQETGSRDENNCYITPCCQLPRSQRSREQHSLPTKTPCSSEPGGIESAHPPQRLSVPLLHQWMDFRACNYRRSVKQRSSLSGMLHLMGGVDIGRWRRMLFLTVFQVVSYTLAPSAFLLVCRQSSCSFYYKAYSSTSFISSGQSLHIFTGQGRHDN